MRYNSVAEKVSRKNIRIKGILKVVNLVILFSKIIVAIIWAGGTWSFISKPYTHLILMEYIVVLMIVGHTFEILWLIFQEYYSANKEHFSLIKIFFFGAFYLIPILKKQKN